VFGDIAEQYEDRADFVHVEVWKDFDAQELNEGAAEWIQTAQGGNEPWTFLIDEEGRIAARWDNVLDADDLIDHLEELPTTTHAEDD
jgi:peroxiredoxin